MLARFKEFIIGNEILPANESTWTAAQKAWVADWIGYIQFGGTRPKDKPPV